VHCHPDTCIDRGLLDGHTARVRGLEANVALNFSFDCIEPALRRVTLVLLVLGALSGRSIAYGQPVARQYGSWPSPITASDAVASSGFLSGLQVDGDQLYVLENRPSEGGRAVVVNVREDGSAHDVTPASFNVRTRVHEYGGGAFTVADGVIYFSNFTDDRLYAQRVGGTPQPITRPGPHRYADCVVDKRRSRLICVREDHSSGPDPKKVINALTETPLDGSKDTRVLWRGSDFGGTAPLPRRSAFGVHCVESSQHAVGFNEPQAR
jgi:hypothetical protein